MWIINSEKSNKRSYSDIDDLLLYLCRFYKHSPNDVGAIGFITDSQATENGAKMKPVIIADCAKFQLIISSTLNNG